MSRLHDDHRFDPSARPAHDVMGRPLAPPREQAVARADPGDGPTGTGIPSDRPTPRRPARPLVARLLASRTALRRAMLLAEIIGPPRGLRRPADR